MANQGVDILARKIVSLERRHAALARAQQLPSSSVRLAEGEDVMLPSAIQNSEDAYNEAGIIGERADSMGDLIDSEVEYGTYFPGWLGDVGESSDIAWDSTQFATDLSLELETELGQTNQELQQAQVELTQALADSAEALSEAEQALLEAEDAVTAANTAAAAASTAEATAQAAQTAAGTAQTAADQAAADALAASNAADTADSKATAAQAAAAQATADASAATSAAATATSAAASAEAEALAAVGIANNKGKVIYQASAPTGANASENNLWIRTSDNKPHTYNGSTWDAVTDQAALDAAATATAADGKATAAQTAANNAQAAADDAQTTADAKGKVIIQPGAPNAADRLPQNLWIDTTGGNNTPKRWDGSNWVVVTDKAATDAAAAAVTAQDRADDAYDEALSAATAAGNAQASADGKNAVWYQNDQPAGSAHKTGDTWFKTNDGNRVYRWNGSAWVTAQFGSSAISDTAVTAAKLANNAVTAGKILDGAITDDKLDNAVKNSITTAQATATNAQTVAGNAQSAAGSAQTAASNAQIDADQAIADALAAANAASAADSKATNAASAASTADGKAVAAQTAAANAASAASTADGKAVAAATAASNAASAASTADGKAVTAQNIANAKGKVIIQSAAPAQADRLVQNLWIDTTNGANTPKRWVSGTTWAVVTDKAATDAAAAAITAKNAADEAQSRADDAHTIASAATTAASAAASAASAAQTAANNAQTTANGKNKIVRSTANASSPGSYIAGDQWWKYSGTQITAMWIHSGSAWVSQTLTDSVITNLNAGSITAGTISAARLSATNIKSVLINAGAIEAANIATGTITAASGIIADLAIGAAKIIDGSITSAKIDDLAVTNAKIANGTIQHAKIGTVDAAKITVGTLNAARIAANTIGAEKLMVADMSNMATVSESVPNTAAHGNWTSTVVDGWAARSVNTDTYFMFRRQHGPLPFKTGDRIRVTFEAYADVAVSSQLRLWTYPAGTGSSNSFDGGNIALTTTPQLFERELTVTAPTEGKTTFLIGLQNLVNRDVRLRNVRAYRMGAGELIVDGSIVADKIAANAVVADKIASNAVTAVKINANAVTAVKIATNAVTAVKIAANAVTAGKIAANAVVAGKIQADAINGMTITGALIRTAESGQRMQFDVNGLRAINSAGSVVGALEADSGGLSLGGVPGKSGAIKLGLDQSGLSGPSMDFWGPSGESQVWLRTHKNVGASLTLSTALGQLYGGVTLRADGSEVLADSYKNRNGRRSASYAEWLYQTTGAGALGPNAGRSYTVTLPVDTFTQPPIVQVSVIGSSRLNAAVTSSSSTTSVAVRFDNFTTANAVAGWGYNLTVSQATLTSAEG